MARTTSEAVEGIIEVESTISLDPFIEVANALVTEICAEVVAYDATRLELIERWLAAHFYAIRDPRRTSETAKTISATYQHAEDLGLASSQYGQMVMILDTNGGLANLNFRSKMGAGAVSVDYLGTENPDAIEEV